MTSSTSSSEAVGTVEATAPAPVPEGRSRAALVWGLCLWIALECLVALSLPVHLGRHELDDRVAAIERVARAPRVVLLSDSVTYGALETIDWRDPRVLDLSSNQSIGVPGNAFLLERLARRLAQVDPDGRVARVVYVLRPPSLATDPSEGAFVETYVTSVFQRPAEIAAMRDELGDDALADAAAAAAFEARWTPPTVRRRGHLLRPLVLGLRRLGQELGAGGPPAELSAAARAQLEREADPRAPWLSEASVRFLPRLRAAAASLGAELELRFAPVAPSLRAAWRANGYEAALLAELTRLLAPESGGGAAVEPEPLLAPQADEAFYDGAHLEIATRREYARALAAYLAELADAR